MSIRPKQPTNNDNVSTDDDNNNTKESHVKAGSVTNNVSANKILPCTLETRDFESSEDDPDDDASLPTNNLQDFEERNTQQMFSPSVLRNTNDNKEPWSEVVRLKKGLRGTATSNPISNETAVKSHHRNNFDALRDDDSSTPRPVSIMNVSNTVHSSVTKLVSLPHLSPSQDSVKEFLPSQELHAVATPTASNKTKNIIVTLDDDIKDHPSLTQINEVFSFVSSNHSDETYNDDDLSYDSSIDSMPQLLQRTTDHSDSSSDGSDNSSDDSSSYYFQDNKDNITEWLANNDDEVVVHRSNLSPQLQADDASIISNHDMTNIDIDDVQTPHVSPVGVLQSTHTSERTTNIDDEENNINDITTAKDYQRTSSSIMTTTANLEYILSNTNDIAK